MSILIDLIRVAGFRGINDLEVSLARVSVLIGPNNSGKSSLIKALQLALGDYGRYLTEEDFYIAQDSKIATEIIVDIRIIPVNPKGVRISSFKDEWAIEFGDKIQSDSNGAFLAIRTRSKQNLLQGGFETTRATLTTWPGRKDWTVAKVKETRLATRFQSLPFISTEAQRDIYHDLRDRSSFVGKILTGIEYNQEDILALEELIKGVNDEAVSKSHVLKNLKSHLGKLNQSISGSGGAEVTPFPKKIRDLSKNFSVYFGETDTNSFSMEYHGMGTRSWASMLTLVSFIELWKKRSMDDSKPFFPILATEEPEAHLHPNAQKTLYHQLSEIDGQLIISTHSPFLAARAALAEIRSLVKTASGVVVRQMINITPEDEKSIAREVLAKRGEILFAKCILLFEGITEEQVIPAMFEVYFGISPWDRGVSCVSVGGKGYWPYILTAASFGIPVCILSDNDGNTRADINKRMTKLTEDTGVSLGENIFSVSPLSHGNDFEKELVGHGLRDELIKSLFLYQTNGSQNERQLKAKRDELSRLTDDNLVKSLHKLKASYSGYLADVLLENPNKKSVNDLIPPNIRTCFDHIKGWLA